MATEFFLGCSGFYYNHWKGRFYPEKLPKTKWLSYYTEYFDTLEVNNTFYRYPSEKLLCVLFQLPPMVHKNMDLLRTIADQLDPSVMNVLEFRHESWWDQEVYDFMDKQGIVFCSVSASELPEALVRTGSAIYVRFHGKDGWYQHNYPNEELQQWGERIKQQNAAKVLCYFNNDYNANAPRNCLTLKGMLEPKEKQAQTPILH